jgi:hypothetical protein
MMKAILSAGILTVGIGLVQVAEAKQVKPTVCLSWVESTMPIDGTPTKVAVCTDRKRPVILTTYTITSVTDEDGASVKAVVGYR